MSTFDYAALRADVLEILDEFGNFITLTREESGAAYDPADGVLVGGSTVSLEGYGVLVGYMNGEINNTSIKATDRKLIFQGDALQIGDLYNDWRVHHINDIDPDESGTVLTIAQMRK